MASSASAEVPAHPSSSYSTITSTTVTAGRPTQSAPQSATPTLTGPRTHRRGIKPRAGIACAVCRQRKVRCDVLELAPGPCTNCRHNEIECVVVAKKKGRTARQRSPVGLTTVVDGIAPKGSLVGRLGGEAEGGPECLTAGNAEERKKRERVFMGMQCAAAIDVLEQFSDENLLRWAEDSHWVGLDEREGRSTSWEEEEGEDCCARAMRMPVQREKGHAEYTNLEATASRDNNNNNTSWGAIAVAAQFAFGWQQQQQQQQHLLFPNLATTTTNYAAQPSISIPAHSNQSNSNDASAAPSASSSSSSSSSYTSSATTSPLLSSLCPPQSQTSTYAPRFAPLHETLPTHEYLRLHRAGALDVPPPTLQHLLLNSYVAFVHGECPVLDVRDIAHVAAYGTQALGGAGSGGNVSLLLFQAVMAAGSVWAGLDDLRAAGYSSREEAQGVLFGRVRALYESDCEIDQLAVVRALLLMSFWPMPPPQQQQQPSPPSGDCDSSDFHTDKGKDGHYYVTAAISLCYRLGLHRNTLPCSAFSGSSNSSIGITASASLSSQRRLSRRIWWAAFIRDRVLALRSGRPARISTADCDVPMLCREDFALGGEWRPRDEGRMEEMVGRCIEKTMLCWSCEPLWACGTRAESLWG